MPPELQALLARVRAARFTFTHEDELQRGLAALFTHEGAAFEREVVLGDAGRIDFVLAEDVGLEVKVGGALAAVTRQLHRYAASGRLRALVLVTSRLRLANLPASLEGLPLTVIDLARSSL